MFFASVRDLELRLMRGENDEKNFLLEGFAALMQP